MAVGGPRRNLTELQSLTVGNEEVDVTKCVRLLGVDFDSHLLNLKTTCTKYCKELLLHVEKYV